MEDSTNKDKYVSRDSNASDLPPPELPFYDEIQSGGGKTLVTNSDSNNSNDNNNCGYSSGSAFNPLPSIYDNLLQENTIQVDNNQSQNIHQVPSLSNDNNTLIDKPSDNNENIIKKNPDSSNLPTTLEIIAPVSQTDTPNTVYSSGTTIPKDPIHQISNDMDDKNMPLIVQPKNSEHQKSCFKRYCISTFEKDELIGLILNLLLWGWISILIISYIGIIHFPRHNAFSGNNSSFDFSGIGSSSSGDAFIIVLIILLIIILIILMPAIYPEFIFVCLYIAYLFFHYKSISFYGKRQTLLFNRKIYNIFVFSTFAGIYKIFARCCHDI